MRAAGLVLGLVGVASIARSEERLEPAPTLDVDTDVLPNGLRVIVAPDPSVGSVVVHVRYAGGAAAEDAQHAGYSHLVERLLGAGTVHTAPGEFDDRIDAAGGFSSSVTTADHTSVFEQVPAGALELALWLEAERMAGLADGIRDDELARVKASIATEYRAAYEDQPYALVDREVRRRVWGTDPAGHDPLGDPAMIAAATRASVRAFVRERYVPANATLAIVGHVEPTTAMALARRYFAWIPGGTPLHATSLPAPVQATIGAPPPAREAPGDYQVVDPVAKVVVAYRAADDDRTVVQLELLSRVLAGARSSRLTRALVDTRLASDVRADVVRSAHGAELRVAALPAGTSEPARLGAKIRAEVARLSTLDEDEALRATIAFRHELALAIENLAFRADALATWQAYAGDANHFDAIVELAGSVQTADLRRVARDVLGEARAITVVGQPKETP